MFDQMRFWLDRGIAGFRLDAVDTLLEDPSLVDEGYRKDAKGEVMLDRAGTPMTLGDKTSNLPEIHEIIRRMRAMIDSYPGDRVLIGEAYLPNVMELDKWYGGAAKDELQLPMDTQVGVRGKLDASVWRQRLDDAETGIHGSLPLLVYDNHDNNRLDRYCKESNGAVPGADCRQIQKMLETILLTSRAVALIYYGDEIGMSTGTAPTQPNRRRDAERTPMQWTPGKNAGFSTADTTWLPVLPDYKTVNVEVETGEPDSLLAWHKTLIELRRKNSVLHEGDQNKFSTGNESLVAFTRTLGTKQVVVVTNFSGTAQESNMGALAGKTMHLLKANFTPGLTNGAVPNAITLPAYGAFIAEIN